MLIYKGIGSNVPAVGDNWCSEWGNRKRYAVRSSSSSSLSSLSPLDSPQPLSAKMVRQSLQLVLAHLLEPFMAVVPD